MEQESLFATSPRADQLRPKSLDKLVLEPKLKNQIEKIWSRLEGGYTPNLILYGPPGSGKTSFAYLYGQRVKGDFETLNAVETGVKDIRRVSDLAKSRMAHTQTRTIVFVDEVHRLNRSQQDVLLPLIEKGVFAFVGATTENPSFYLNSALLSRCLTLHFESHSLDSLKKIAHVFFESLSAGSGELRDGTGVDFLTNESLDHLLVWCDGDARRLISELEYLSEIHKWSEFQDNRVALDLAGLKEDLSTSTLRMDRSGDQHYSLASALIKSLRGSDIDASLYYCARMLEGGEDPRFIVRRLVIFASEDIGNADPRALMLATSSHEAVAILGMPEARIPLGQLVVYLASAPKSNSSYLAINNAINCVKETGSIEPPKHILNAPTKWMKQQGLGEGYQYPHNFPKGWVDKAYLPKAIEDKIFYKSKGAGFEKQMDEYTKWRTSIKDGDSR